MRAVLWLAALAGCNGPSLETTCAPVGDQGCVADIDLCIIMSVPRDAFGTEKEHKATLAGAFYAVGEQEWYCEDVTSEAGLWSGTLCQEPADKAFRYACPHLVQTWAQ